MPEDRGTAELTRLTHRKRRAPPGVATRGRAFACDNRPATGGIEHCRVAPSTAVTESQGCWFESTGGAALSDKHADPEQRQDQGLTLGAGKCAVRVLVRRDAGTLDDLSGRVTPGRASRRTAPLIQLSGTRSSHVP